MDIKKLRLSVGLTQKELCAQVDIAVRTYQLYEQGIRVPDARTAIRIAQVLGTTVECLWDGNPTTQKQAVL